MNLNKSDLLKLNGLEFGNDGFNSSSHLYRDDYIIYKIFDNEYFFNEDVEKNIDFQISHFIPNVPVIFDKIYMDGMFRGYTMEYLENTITFRNACYVKLSYDVCVNVCKNIYECIKFLNRRNIFLGDIHMDNFLIDNNGYGYVVDLDYMNRLGDNFKFNRLYDIKLNHNSNKIIISSLKTDNIKSMICCLSILFGIDLERKFVSVDRVIDLENVYEVFIKSLGIGELNQYFYNLISDDEVDYFDDFLLKNYYKILNNGNVMVKNRGLRLKK